MEKFSKLRPKNEFNEPDDEIVYQDDKIKIKQGIDKLNTHAISGKVPVGLEHEYFQLLHAIELLRNKVYRI